MVGMKVVLCILLLAGTVAAQEHTPSKAQCDIDLNFWSTHLTTGEGVWTLRDDDKIGFLEIVDAVREMGKCEEAYVTEKRVGSGPYSDLVKTLDSLLETRMIKFMQ